MFSLLLQEGRSGYSAAFYTRTPVDWNELQTNEILTGHKIAEKSGLSLWVGKARQTKYWLPQLWLKEASFDFDSLIQNTNKDQCQKRNKNCPKSTAIYPKLQAMLSLRSYQLMHWID